MNSNDQVLIISNKSLHGTFSFFAEFPNAYILLPIFIHFSRTPCWVRVAGSGIFADLLATSPRTPTTSSVAGGGDGGGGGGAARFLHRRSARQLAARPAAA